MVGVNTIVRHGDKFIGENTDGRGFVRGLSEVIDPAPMSSIEAILPITRSSPCRCIVPNVGQNSRMLAGQGFMFSGPMNLKVSG